MKFSQIWSWKQNRWKKYSSIWNRRILMYSESVRTRMMQMMWRFCWRMKMKLTWKRLICLCRMESASKIRCVCIWKKSVKCHCWVQRKKLNWRNGWQKVMKMRKRGLQRQIFVLLSALRNAMWDVECYFLTWFRKEIWDWSKRLKSLIIRKDSNSVRMRHGGSDRQLRERLQIRREPFVFRFIWWRQLTNWFAYQDSCCRNWGVSRCRRRLQKNWTCRWKEYARFWRFLRNLYLWKHRSVKKRTVIWEILFRMTMFRCRLRQQQQRCWKSN